MARVIPCNALAKSELTVQPVESHLSVVDEAAAVELVPLGPRFDNDTRLTGAASRPSRAVAMSSFIAICARVDPERYGDSLPGSLTRPCFDCGRYVVLGTSTMQREPKWVVCDDCGTSLLAMHPVLDWFEYQVSSHLYSGSVTDLYKGGCGEATKQVETVPKRSGVRTAPLRKGR